MRVRDILNQEKFIVSKKYQEIFTGKIDEDILLLCTNLFSVSLTKNNNYEILVSQEDFTEYMQNLFIETYNELIMRVRFLGLNGSDFYKDINNWKEIASTSAEYQTGYHGYNAAGEFKNDKNMVTQSKFNPLSFISSLNTDFKLQLEMLDYEIKKYLQTIYK